MAQEPDDALQPKTLDQGLAVPPRGSVACDQQNGVGAACAQPRHGSDEAAMPLFRTEASGGAHDRSGGVQTKLAANALARPRRRLADRVQSYPVRQDLNLVGWDAVFLDCEFSDRLGHDDRLHHSPRCTALQGPQSRLERVHVVEVKEGGSPSELGGGGAKERALHPAEVQEVHPVVTNYEDQVKQRP